MTHSRLALIFVSTAIFTCNGVLNAQESLLPATDEISVTSETEGSGLSQPENAEASADNMADQLNSQQQLQQSFTFRRTINGEVVETDRRTVTYDHNTPFRATEAGPSTLERLKSRFDAEVLTRTEAFEESKLDFTVADTNRDDVMSIDEFSKLVASWKEADTRDVDEPTTEQRRQKQYDAFIAEISPETAKMKADQFANKKFLFLTGGMNSVARKDYIREYLLDFDAMDMDKDTILRGDELRKFRALNRGETFETQE